MPIAREEVRAGESADAQDSLSKRKSSLLSCLCQGEQLSQYKTSLFWNHRIEGGSGIGLSSLVDPFVDRR
ncbi:Hypothetical protein NTJ_07677 [Nesidiocoris tenuis]|uniref:Uncharacterized protein n=1 Tax=Nesidiocoris tenuis TaxID=355587 RepID=A0ABN7ASE7_9HEMI|nr:Hypothetical protein NTJ_07677 [Nesidiocoris tenuis]